MVMTAVLFALFFFFVSSQYNEASKEAYLKQARELQDLKRRLRDNQAEAVRSQGELEATVVSATAKLETTRIDLVRVVRDYFPSKSREPPTHV